MKRTIIYVLFLLVTVVFSATMLKGMPLEEEWDKDNYGKVIGQLVDAETGEPVNEKFEVVFYFDVEKTSDYRIIKSMDTDENGRFVTELIPYNYNIQFFPLSEDSKYCVSPSPNMQKRTERITIKIERGKITYLQKKAELAGKLKIYTVDNNNNRFNPKEIFDEKFSISTEVSSGIYAGINYGNDNLDDGEVNIKKLHPGIYSVRITFEGLGYSTIKKESIQVEKGKTTDVLINIDIADNTGIEGTITDANGTTLENAYIGLSPIDRSIEGRFVAYANKNGFYKLRGMPEGLYYISHYYYIKEKKNSIGFPTNRLVKIKKNFMFLLDIKLEYTKNKLEGNK